MDVQRYVSANEVRMALARIYRDDAESNLRAAFLRALSDPLKPVDEKGRWKPNPVLVLLFLLLCAMIGIFLYFSIAGGQ